MYINELSVLIEKMDIALKRLREQIREVSCNYVYSIYDRYKTVEKEYEKTLKRYESVKNKYSIIREKIGKYEKEYSRIFKTFMLLLIIGVTSGIALIMMITIPGAILNFLLPYISLIIVLSSSIIVVIILAFIYVSTGVKSKYNIKKLKQKESELKSKVEYYKDKVDNLKVQMDELTTSFHFRDYYACICYDEFSTLYSLIVDLNDTIQKLRNSIRTNNYDTSYSQATLLKDILTSLLDKNQVCSSVYNVEYSVEVRVEPGALEFINELTSLISRQNNIDGDLNSIGEAIINFRFRGINYRIDLAKKILG